MPSHAPRDLEPYKKKEILEKREQQLMYALKSGNLKRIERAAEDVRAAQLGVLKAKYEIAYYKPDTEQKVHQFSNIERERTRWETVSTEDIVLEYEQKRT